MRIIGTDRLVSISVTGRMPGMSFKKWCSFGILAFLICVCPWGNPGRDPNIEKKRVALGRELFGREWVEGDPRSHAGDGLGPVFNARSCLACHILGGIGGGGAKHTNVTIVDAFLLQDDAKAPKQPKRDRLARIHPALRTEN